MKILGVIGKSGSGKTTLIARLVTEFSTLGLSVSTIKHAKDGVDLDRPGKDSYVHREAGAREVMIATPSRWALLHELRGAAEPKLGELLATLKPVNVVLVEGLREDEYDCIEVRRNDVAAVTFDHPRKIAIASNVFDTAARVPVLDLNMPCAIAEFLYHHWRKNCPP